MKICLLCYRANPYSGGQGIYLKYIAEEMVRQGHEVHAVTGPPYPDFMEGVILHKIPNNQYYIKKGPDIIDKEGPFSIFSPINFYEYFNSRLGCFPEISSFGYRAYLLLKELHKEHSFDIIHDNQSVGYGLLLMKSLGIPVTATIHHPLSIDLASGLERMQTFKKKVKTVMFYPILMQSFVAKRLDHIITVSEDSRKTINRDFGVPLERQTVVYNGIDRAIFRPLKDVKKKKGKILFVGNIEDGKKGFVYLMKALPMIREDIRLTVIDGGAPHRKVTMAILKKMDIAHRIDFAGTAAVDDLVRHYCEAEMTIVPSVYEGFGFPAAEAMSCGSPVIASDGGALTEVVGDAGIVVPARTVEPIARSVNELMEDQEKLQHYSKAGIRRVQEFFNWENAVADMVEVFNTSIRAL